MTTAQDNPHIKLIDFNMQNLDYLYDDVNDLYLAEKDYDITWMLTAFGYYENDAAPISRTDTIVVKNPCHLVDEIEINLVVDAELLPDVNYNVDKAAVTISIPEFELNFKNIFSMEPTVCGNYAIEKVEFEYNGIRTLVTESTSPIYMENKDGVDTYNV